MALGHANRWVLYGGAAVIVVGGGLIYRAATKHNVAIPASDIYTVGYGSVVQTISASGTVEPLQQVNLNFPAGGGILSTVNVKVGQAVKAGQVLATLSDPSAQAAIQSAEAAVASAEANLASLQAGPTPQAIAVDQANVQHAQIQLAGAEQQYQDAQQSLAASAQQTLDNAQNQVAEDNAALQAAQANVASAQNKLQQAEAGVSTSTVNSLPATISSDQQALKADQAQLAADQQTLSNAQQTLQQDQTTLQQDQSLYGTLASQYPQDEQAYQQALENYNSWSGYGTNPYQSLVNSTQVAASAAQNAYNTLQSIKTQVASDQAAVLEAQKQVAADQAAIQNAQAALTQAEDQQANLNQTNPLTVQAAQVALQQAQASLAQAQAAYQGAVNSVSVTKSVTQASDQSQLDQLKSTVQLDQNAVTQAEDALNEAQAPPTPAQLAAAEAQVQSAKAQLASAQAEASNDILKAPFNGVIVASNYNPGDTVSSATPVFVLDNTIKNDLEAQVEVAEADIGQVKAGESVALTASAYPNQTFTGKVFEVEPNPQTVDNVTEYTVLTTVNNPGGLLLPGMTTNVTINTGEVNHVLTVPPVALQTLGSTQGVYVMASSFKLGAFHPNPALLKKFKKLHAGTAGGGFVHRTGASSGVVFIPVQVGLFGTNSVQVTRGVFPGEKILLVPPSSLNIQARGGFLFGGGRGGFGGGGGRFNSGGSGAGASIGGTGGQ